MVFRNVIMTWIKVVKCQRKKFDGLIFTNLLLLSIIQVIIASLLPIITRSIWVNMGTLLPIIVMDSLEMVKGNLSDFAFSLRQIKAVLPETQLIIIIKPRVF